MPELPQSTHVLQVICPDRPGLIHLSTEVLFKHGLNITENHEFVDHQKHLFFMRTAFSGDFDDSQVRDGLQKSLGSEAKIRLIHPRPRRLILMATKEPHCLGDLLLRHDAGELNAEILAVVSQYDSLKKLTERFEIPFHHVPVVGTDREGHEKALLEVIAPYKVDYLILTKYMRILSQQFIGQFKNKILNIHHSFLPAFIGKKPYDQAYERGVKIIGATAHIVDENLDEGPIITQSVIPISHSQDATQLALAGRDVEKIVLAHALKLLLEDRIIIHGRRTLVFE